MPTYEYVCQSCGEKLEAVQKMADPSLTACPACGGLLRKVFHPAGIMFKGSGFYATDNRSTSKSGTADKADKGEKKSDKSDKSAAKADTGATGSSTPSDSGGGEGKPTRSAGAGTTSASGDKAGGR